MIRVAAKPRPTNGQLRDALRAFAKRSTAAVDPYSLTARDTDFIREVAPLFDVLYDHYFRCETELEEELAPGAALAVANHNGMTGIPDMFCHMVAWWRLRDVAEASYGLMHDFPFRMPVAGPWLNGAGAIAACPKNADAALASGAKVLVFPGGDIDACKPYRERYRIDFGQRRGFLRVAIRNAVPIIPVVSVGAHSSLFLWSDGQALAQKLRLPQLLRSNVFPIGFALPWGFIFGNPLPHVPLPVKVHTRILRAIHLPYAPEEANEPEVLEKAYSRVVTAMREAIASLRQAGRHGLFPRQR